MTPERITIPFDGVWTDGDGSMVKVLNDENVKHISVLRNSDPTKDAAVWKAAGVSAVNLVGVKSKIVLSGEGALRGSTVGITTPNGRISITKAEN